MKEINLEEILRKNIGYLGNEPNLTKLIHERAIGLDILNAMKEACQKTLELASENARFNMKIDVDYDIIEEASIDKDSILNTINQIK